MQLYVMQHIKKVGLLRLWAFLGIDENIQNRENKECLILVQW